jgi:(p)ppGpp synthase/HD superfamily hydrolase
MLEKAISISVNAHYGQDDAFGQPKILHLLRVMLKGENETEQITGVLHDLIEDTDWTIEGLKREGFSYEIINAIDLLTRRDEEEYECYVDRLSNNSLALRIKLFDIEDNLDITRSDSLSQRDISKLNKYLNAYQKLNSIKGKILIDTNNN